MYFITVNRHSCSLQYQVLIDKLPLNRYEIQMLWKSDYGGLKTKTMYWAG
jgi:hypothetical protein